MVKQALGRNLSTENWARWCLWFCSGSTSRAREQHRVHHDQCQWGPKPTAGCSMDSHHSYFSAASTNAGLNSMFLSLHCWLLDWSKQVKYHWLTSFTGVFTGLQCSGSGPTLKCHSSASFFSLQQCLDGSKVLVFLVVLAAYVVWAVLAMQNNSPNSRELDCSSKIVHWFSLCSLLQPKHKIWDSHF
jgi:hypothetical protein